MDLRHTRPRRQGAMTGAGLLSGLTIRAPFGERDAEILTPDALQFLQALVRDHRAAIRQAVALNEDRRRDASRNLELLTETRRLRDETWRTDPVPAYVERRTVELVGPAVPASILAGLNSDADSFVADFADSLAPTWANCIGGQVALRDAVRGQLTRYDPVQDQTDRVADDPATLFVRPRAFHLREHHVLLDGHPVPAALFDFGMFFYHNCAELVRRGRGPLVYLSRLESHLEARVWNRVFRQAERLCGAPEGTIRATAMIETVPAAFEMDEILWELRTHSAGLAFGPRNYLVSLVEWLGDGAEAVLPDRSRLTMEQPFLRACSRLMLQTAHRRGAHAIGGSPAWRPLPRDRESAGAREALAQIRLDRLTEARDGYDGTLLVQADEIGLAREAFRSVTARPNQLDVVPDGHVAATDLKRPPAGSVSDEGLRLGIRVGIRCFEAWLTGRAQLSLYGRLEDAASADLARGQIWQWTRHGTRLTDGRTISPALLRRTIDEEMLRIRVEVGPEHYADGRFAEARSLFERLCCAESHDGPFSLHAYDMLETARR